MAVVLLALCVASAAAGSTLSFSFRDAEFMERDEAARAVDAFLNVRLPVGLPLDAARERLVRADMTCRNVRRDGSEWSCAFSMPTHADGGVIGDDTWMVRLIAKPSGRLAYWTVDHNRVSSNP